MTDFDPNIFLSDTAADDAADDPMFQQVKEALERRQNNSLFGVDDPTSGPSTNATDADPTSTGGSDATLPGAGAAPDSDTSSAGGDTLPPPSAGETPADQPPPVTPDTTATGQPSATTDGSTQGEQEYDLLRITNGDEQYELTNEQVLYLLALNSWIESVPPETRETWGAIRAGEAVAISREDYLAFQQWKSNPTPPTTEDRPDLTYVDEEVRDYIKSLESRAKTPAPGQQSTTLPGPGQAANELTSEQVSQIIAEQERERSQRLAILQSVKQQVVERYGLTEQEASLLDQRTYEARIVPTITERNTTYAPTGEVLRRAPIDKVMEEAYETVMALDPTLRNKRDERIVNERQAALQEQTQAVNQKKARAASLAAAPSSTPPASSGRLGLDENGTMNLAATSAAIAAAIRNGNE